MFGKTCYFLFLRGLLDKEQKMDYLTAMSIDCLGGHYLNDIRVWNESQLRVLAVECGMDKVTIKKVGQWSSDTVEGYFLAEKAGVEFTSKSIKSL